MWLKRDNLTSACIVTIINLFQGDEQHLEHMHLFRTLRSKLSCSLLLGNAYKTGALSLQQHLEETR